MIQTLEKAYFGIMESAVYAPKSKHTDECRFMNARDKNALVKARQKAWETNYLDTV